MTTEQRTPLPDTIRTNGAEKNPWWANAVVYQVYPRSFQDTNGDGYGDLPGITSRLDYLADLGVDVIWLSPVYKSPQDDNGYDISDYQDIDPMFGTLNDMDELLAEAHDRGLKVVMDLVVNHTSDEHAWFQASRDKNDPHADWYWWRPAKEGHEPGTPGAEPNHWGSYFGGSAWEYDPKRGEYYLHQFSKKQPDLNWENPDVRAAVYKMMNWWLDRGVDGFRMDVITLISKHVDANGELPGVGANTESDGPIGPDGYSSPNPFCADGPRQDEFLAEMHREVFDGREGTLTVGEAPGITAERNQHITDPANRELDMLFLFDHVEPGGGQSKWTAEPWKLTHLKHCLAGHQHAVKKTGWTSLFFNNHDQPRVVSRWGDDSTDELRVRSAKAIALLLHMHRGTPYVYQGEELGMTNAYFDSLDQYRDLESINMYHQLTESGVMTPEAMMDALKAISRDNSRTPMQWDATKYAGFTAPYAPTEPWLPVNDNRDVVNAKKEKRDPDSVYNFYKKLIALRHENPVISAGEWEMLDADDPQVYAFVRTLRNPSLGGGIDGSGERRIVVVVNMSSESAKIPAEAADLLGLGLAGTTLGGVSADRILISTYPTEDTAADLLFGKLAPWEAFAYEL
ncbi:alpha-amylase [Bifidobacterium sp. UTCIF-39]|uniref:glycoside hydrolase family 13 protein n=1 Tax=Bifidobacterium sp. UTCIF-39 TaxID=1465359 RepID=UPI00112D3B6E|nr:alpha-glucosidase [Bifidobacterium sp. UTCIF-39]TPF96667.1 alpha-amylase [Bifidobacterium sp. UTCIF-39]